jgi:tetratricopeptide (TPR) repeat protein
MLTALLPILLMQVGIAPTAPTISDVPPELRDRPRRNEPAPERSQPSAAIDTCLATARSEPAKSRALAEEWVARTTGAQRAAGSHCLGVAASNSGDWASASAAFLAARADASEPRFRARMSALAGSALLAEGKPEEALGTLDGGIQDAAGDAELTGAIALDRASALVALGRESEAAGALAEARTAVPLDAQAWLLSATLSRRTGDLAAAQMQVEQAATIDPRDPAIGLEAGVIAALAGRDGAARKSFESVLAAAPDSSQAAAARQYLAQLSGG